MRDIMHFVHTGQEQAVEALRESGWLEVAQWVSAVHNDPRHAPPSLCDPKTGRILVVAPSRGSRPSWLYTLTRRRRSNYLARWGDDRDALLRSCVETLEYLGRSCAEIARFPDRAWQEVLEIWGREPEEDLPPV